MLLDPRFHIVLATVCVFLKLAGSVDWSWWWVFSPMWVGFLAYFAYRFPGAYRRAGRK